MTLLADQVRALFPWVPPQLVGVFTDAWASNGGDVTLTQAAVRADPSYDLYFAGNKRPDGTVYLPEDQYLATIEGYQRALKAVGVDPTHFTGQLPELIAADVSPAEFSARIAQVLTAAPEVRNAFGELGHSTDFSDAGIVASWLSGPTGGSPQEFDRMFQIAGIQGGVAASGFTLASSDAQRYAQLGVSAQQAEQVGQAAATDIPQINDLLARHNDPHDPFDIGHYLNAVLLQNPDDKQAIARAVTGEKASYSAQHLGTQDQQGGDVSLRQR